MKDTDFWHMMNYAEKVSVFNSRCGSSYSHLCRFLTFKITRRGILVGYTVGKPREILQLIRDVSAAGKPFYFNAPWL